jgi:hypothetical protein
MLENDWIVLAVLNAQLKHCFCTTSENLMGEEERTRKETREVEKGGRTRGTSDVDLVWEIEMKIDFHDWKIGWKLKNWSEVRGQGPYRQDCHRIVTSRLTKPRLDWQIQKRNSSSKYLKNSKTHKNPETFKTKMQT